MFGHKILDLGCRWNAHRIQRGGSLLFLIRKRGIRHQGKPWGVPMKFALIENKVADKYVEHQNPPSSNPNVFPPSGCLIQYHIFKVFLR